MLPLRMDYQSPRLTPNEICTTIDRRAGTTTDHVAPSATTDTQLAAVAAGRSIATQLLRKQQAAVDLATTRRSILEHHEDQLRTLESASEEVAADYRTGRPKSTEDGDALDRAIRLYVADHGDYFLMQLILQGHTTLQSFLASMQDNMGATEGIEEYAARFLELYCVRDLYEPDELCSSYEHDLHSATQTLREFLENAVTLTGVTVVKGIKSAIYNDPDKTTAVDTLKYVNALLAGDWIHHRGFLSTSASWSVAEQFCTCDEDLEPLLSVRMDDRGLEGQALKAMLGTRLQAMEFDQLSVMHVFRCEGAKGAVIEAVTGNYPLESEREILLAPDHVSTPEQLILCDKAVVLVSSVTHISQLSGEAARAWFFRNEWKGQKETMQDEFRAWSNGEGSGEAFLAHLASACTTSPAIRDYGAHGGRPGLLTEHRIEPVPGHPPFTVLYLKHPVHPGAGFIRKVPAGASEHDHGLIIQEMIDAARTASNTLMEAGRQSSLSTSAAPV